MLFKTMQNILSLYNCSRLLLRMTFDQVQISAFIRDMVPISPKNMMQKYGNKSFLIGQARLFIEVFIEASLG